MKIGLLVWGVKPKSQINLASWGCKLALDQNPKIGLLIWGV
jgi:hypothetical protein